MLSFKHVGDSGFVIDVYKSAHLLFHNTSKDQMKWTGTEGLDHLNNADSYLQIHNGIGKKNLSISKYYKLSQDIL